eukprot:scaffold13166_cov114-Isochrysis_galbana.AAC.4
MVLAGAKTAGVGNVVRLWCDASIRHGSHSLMLEHAPAAPRLDQKARVVVHDRPRVPECGRVGATPPPPPVAAWCESEKVSHLTN